MKAPFARNLATLLLVGCLSSFVGTVRGYAESRSNSPFGLHGVGMPFLKEANAVNTSMVRIIISGSVWKKLENEKGLNFQVLDHIVRESQRYGVDLVITLDSNSDIWGHPALANRTSGGLDPTKHSNTPADIARYASVLRAIAERYDHDGQDDMPELARPIDYYQVVNEWIWQWEGTKEAYLEHLKLSRASLLSAHPKARIILGGLTMVEHLAIEEGFSPSGKLKIGGMVGRDTPEVVTLEAIRKKYPARVERSISRLKYILRVGRPYFDIIDFHDYSESYAEMLPSIMVLKKLAPGKPLWSMENGGPFYKYSSEKHSEELVKRYLAAQAHGVRKLFWSSYHPTVGWSQNFLNLALVTISFGEEQRKPSWHTYRFLADNLEGVRGVTRMEQASGAEVYRIDTERGLLYVVWSESGPKDVRLPWAERTSAPRALVLRVDDMLIHEEKIPLVIKGGEVKLSVSRRPVFIGGHLFPLLR